MSPENASMPINYEELHKRMLYNSIKSCKKYSDDILNKLEVNNIPKNVFYDRIRKKWEMKEHVQSQYIIKK
jgi:hypothetical protein